MSKDQTITATEASRGFSDLLHRVCYGGESFVIKKGQRMMARITPVTVEKPEVTESATVEEAPVNMTRDEAEFYQAWMEQVRRVDA